MYMFVWQLVVALVVGTVLILRLIITIFFFTIVVLKVTTLLLLRISLKPSSYGKVDEAIVTLKKKESAR